MAETAAPQDTTRYVGRVKWFNNKNGFGFISYADGDVFVHHSELQTDSEQFRYLVEGEYVEFALSMRKDKDEKEQLTAVSVTGPNSGILMCQTRSERRDRMSSRAAEEGEGGEADDDKPQRRPRRKPQQRQRRSQTDSGNVEVGSKEWKLVGGSKKPRGKGKSE